MSGTSVSEIHAYPSRPEGFEEPLFATPDFRRAVMEHLLRAPWLVRASRLEKRCGGSARSFREPVEIEDHRGPARGLRPRGGAYRVFAVPADEERASRVVLADRRRVGPVAGDDLPPRLRRVRRPPAPQGAFLLEGRVEHSVEKGFAFLVQSVADLREALTGAETPIRG